MRKTHDPARRAALARAGHAGMQIALVAVAQIAPYARAAKASKQDFSYQDQPRQGKSCATCRQFLPNSGGPGHCAVVDGEISPSGWCMAYALRE